MRDPNHKSKLLFDKAHKSSDRKRGIKLLTKAIKLDNQYSDAYALRSICFSMEGKHSDARLDLDKAIALNPNSIATKYAKTVYLASVNENKQVIEVSTQVINEVIREQILDKQDSSPKIGRFKFTEEDLANLYSYRALSAIGLQNYSSAIEDFNAIQHLNVSDKTKDQALQLKKGVLRKIEVEKEQKRKSKFLYKASRKLYKFSFMTVFVLSCITGLTTVACGLWLLAFVNPAISTIALFLLVIFSPGKKSYYFTFIFVIFLIAFFVIMTVANASLFERTTEGLSLVKEFFIVLLTGAVGGVLTYLLFALNQIIADKANSV